MPDFWEPPAEPHGDDPAVSVPPASLARLTDTGLADLVLARLDTLIAALDRRIGAQLDEILHHPAFQRLERA